MDRNDRLKAFIATGHSVLSSEVIMALQDKLAEVSELYERHQKWRSMDLRNIRKHEETIRLLRNQLSKESEEVSAAWQARDDLLLLYNHQAMRIKELEWQYSQASESVPMKHDDDCPVKMYDCDCKECCECYCGQDSSAR